MKRFWVVNNFKYVVLYCDKMTKSFSGAEFIDQFSTLDEAISKVKLEMQSSVTEDEKYYIALIQEDIYYPIMSINRKDKTIYISAV